MKKGLLITMLVLGAVVIAAAGNPQKKGMKPKYQAKADTSFNIKSDSFDDFATFDIEKMMKEEQRQSSHFMDDALAMLDEIPNCYIDFPAKLDSIIKMEREEFIDSTGNCKFHKHRGMVIPRPQIHGRKYRLRTDSLGKNESIVVLNDGKKTTIIKNGKDTTIIDGPMGNVMDNFGGDINHPFSHQMMPRFNFRSFEDGDFNEALPRAFGNDRVASESPSVEEMEMLAKKGVVSSKDLKNSLEIENVSIRSNNRGSTYLVSFGLEGAEQCELQVVASDGMTLEKSTIIGSQGRFKRTVKITPNQDYVYVVISFSKKISVNKFWL